MHTYDDTFYKYINSGSVNSARRILPILSKYFSINSVVDFGCGQGAWLKVWNELETKDIIGIDGDYVKADDLLIDEDKFVAADLSKNIQLNRKFDLVQSLEVAEHLPESSATLFINNLAKHGDIIMFSAAVPGQGGEDHLNEQPLDYWRQIFESHNFVPFDLIRPEIKTSNEVEVWYKYNVIVYINKNCIENLSEEIHRYKINEKIQDISPLLYKIRKLIIKLLPTSVKTKIAVIKKHLLSRFNSQKK